MARTIAKDHAEKREQILSTAAQVFAAEGFDRASMNQIAAACGISKANIYHYYDSKDALLFDLLEGYLKGLRDRVAAQPMDGLSPEDRLRRTVRAILKAYQGADDVHRVQMAGIGALPPDRQEVLRGYQRDMVRHLGGIVTGLAPELAQDKARRHAVTMSIFGMLNWYFMWNSGAGSEARDAYADVVSTLVLGGIRGL